MDFGPGERLQCGGFFGEEAGGEGAIGVGVEEAARGVEERVVTVMGRSMGEETAVGVEAVERGEGGGMAGEEGGGRRVVRAVAAGGAFDPDEVTAGIGDKKEALGRGTEADVDEVLAGAGGGAGDERGFKSGVGAREEEGEAVGVGGEGLGRGGEGGFVKKGELQEVGGGGDGGGIGVGEMCEKEEEERNEKEEWGNGEHWHCCFGRNTQTQIKMCKTMKTDHTREQLWFFFFQFVGSLFGPNPMSFFIFHFIY